MNPVDIMFAHYVRAALWSTNDESREDGGDPLDDNYTIEDLDESCAAQMKKDCESFYNENKQDIGEDVVDVERAGHDFWLTRNGHGAGFWDGDWDTDANPERGERLTAACKKYHEVNLMVDNGKIFC